VTGVGAPFDHVVEVLGTPAPQGSKRHVGHGRMIESSKLVKPWRAAVALAGYTEFSGKPPISQPVTLHLEFWLHRPKTAAKRAYPHHKPDLDKLVRSTLDGLVEGGVLQDDALVVDLHATKRYTATASGAHIGIVVSLR